MVKTLHVTEIKDNVMEKHSKYTKRGISEASFNAFPDILTHKCNKINYFSSL